MVPITKGASGAPAGPQPSQADLLMAMAMMKQEQDKKAKPVDGR